MNKTGDPAGIADAVPARCTAAARLQGRIARLPETQGRKVMTTNNESMSFYFFDFDDNTMFLSTPIFVKNKKTDEQ